MFYQGVVEDIYCLTNSPKTGAVLAIWYKYQGDGTALAAVPALALTGSMATTRTASVKWRSRFQLKDSFALCDLEKLGCGVVGQERASGGGVPVYYC